MAKKRKTRREKQLSDLRQIRSTTPSVDIQVPSSDEPLSFRYTGSTKSSVTTIQSSQYLFLIQDLRKTALTTGALIALELALFYAGKTF